MLIGWNDKCLRAKLYRKSSTGWDCLKPGGSGQTQTADAFTPAVLVSLDLSGLQMGLEEVQVRVRGADNLSEKIAGSAIIEIVCLVDSFTGGV